MHFLTPAERQRLDPAEFGDPEHRLFPVVDQEDVDTAVWLINRSNPAGGFRG
jgi:hypothetical protein